MGDMNENVRRVTGRRPSGMATVPAAPFTNWLQSEYEAEAARGEAPAKVLATRLGLCPDAPTKKQADAAVRRLYRLRNARLETRRAGKTVVLPALVYARRDVEEMCNRVDGGLFARLYPDCGPPLGDPFDDITLEPDAWCPYCKQNVTPIDGLCPWCVCEHGHVFREVGFTESGFACLRCAKTGRARSADSADLLSPAFEGDGVTDEMVERLRAGLPPLPLQRKEGYEQAIRLRAMGLRVRDVAEVMKSYHGVDRSPQLWGRLLTQLEEAA